MHENVDCCLPTDLITMLLVQIVRDHFISMTRRNLVNGCHIKRHSNLHASLYTHKYDRINCCCCCSYILHWMVCDGFCFCWLFCSDLRMCACVCICSIIVVMIIPLIDYFLHVQIGLYVVNNVVAIIRFVLKHCCISSHTL